MVLFCNFLITICTNEDSISNNQKYIEWNRLNLNQKLAQFELILKQNLDKISLENNQLLKQIILKCQLMFYINFKVKVTDKLTVIGLCEQQKQLLKKDLIKIQEQIYLLTTKDVFIKQQNLFLIQQKLTTVKLRSLQNLTFNQYYKKVSQFLILKTCEIYGHANLKSYAYWLFTYLQKFYLQDISMKSLKNKIQSITRKQIYQLVFLKKSNTTQQFQQCDVEELIFTSQFKILYKHQVNVKIDQSEYKVTIAKQLSLQNIKKRIVNQLNKGQFRFLFERVRIALKFQHPVQIAFEDGMIFKTIEEKYGKIVSIQVQKMVEITVYYEGQQLVFYQWNKDSISILKNFIKQKISLSVESQKLCKQVQNINIEIEDKQSLYSSKLFTQKITLQLTLRQNLSFYGFEHNYSIDHNKFKLFLIQNQKQLEDFVKQCTLEPHQESMFFSKLIPYFFSTLKKRLSLQATIQKIRQKIKNKKTQQIWISRRQSNTFNATFIIYYLLYNSDKLLRIQIMNSIKHSYSLPLYYRKFISLNQLTDSWNINDELMWLLKDEVHIASIGLHNQNRLNQNGKSNILNEIFFTKFEQRNNRHPILSSCPYIHLRIYQNKYPANLIDISPEVPLTVTKDILKKVNFIILHSWKNEEETIEYQNSIRTLYQPNVYILTLMRDQNIHISKHVILKQFKDNKIFIENMSKLGKSQQKSIITQIRQLVHKKIVQVLFTNSTNTQLIPFIKSQNEDLKQLQQLAQKIPSIIRSFRSVSTLFKNLTRGLSQKHEIDQIVQQNKQKFDLNPVIKSVINLLIANSQKFLLLFGKFKQWIKTFKTYQEQKYKILLDAQNQLKNLDQNLLSYKQKSSKYIQQIFRLDQIEKFKTESKTDILKGITESISKYQNEIKPNLLSIELFWRQLYLITEINPDYSINNYLLTDFIVEAQRKQTFNNKPFELIDGDSLRMHKNILIKIFNQRKQSIVIITILGKQSSGKSTLLNILFGSDFKASEGRCTRGVYTTYYDIANKSMFGCSSVLLIDTEGLLSITNKKDAKVRNDFDSKLILFCLAISKFVIINSPLDLDIVTLNILKSCNLRLPSLCNNSDPKFWLVMNQNPTNDISNRANDINRVKEFLKIQESFSFSQAYELQLIDKNKISILGNTIITKRTSKVQFQKQAQLLRYDITSRFSTQKYPSIQESIQKMEVVWSTIERFPDIGKNITIEIKQINDKIIEWKKQNTQKILLEIQKLLKQFAKNIKNKNKIVQQLDWHLKQMLKNFEETFVSNHNLQEIKQQITKNSELIIEQHHQIKKDLLFQIQSSELINQIQKSKLVGNSDIYYEIQQINRLPSTQKLTNQQKQRRFQTIFEQCCNKIQKSIQLKQKLISMFERVKQTYKSLMKQTSILNEFSYDQVLLPQLKIEVSIEKQSKDYFDMFRQIFKEEKQSMIIQHSKASPTNPLKGGNIDASLQYFNMKKYFQQQKTEIYLTISKNSLLESISTQKLHYYIQSQYLKFKKDQYLKIIHQVSQILISRVYFENIRFTQIEQVKSAIFFVLFTKYENENILKNASIFVQKSSTPFFVYIKRSNCQTQCDSHSKFINQQELLKLLKRLPIPLQYRHQGEKNLSEAIIRKAINYEKILEQINYAENIVENTETFIKQMTQKIQNQFQHIGIRVEAQQYVIEMLKKDLCNVKPTTLRIKGSSSLFLQSNEKLKNHFKDLIWLDGNKIEQCLKQQYQSQELQLTLGIVQKNILIPIQTRTKSWICIEDYLNKQHKEVIRYLESQYVITFLWDELNNKASFEKLFKKLENIIQLNFKRKLEINDTIKHIYSDTKQELSKFNKDLAQLSRKLTFYAQGFFNLFVVYLTWKQASKQYQKVLSRPLDEFKGQYTKQKKHFMNLTSKNISEIIEAQTQQFLQSLLKEYHKQCKSMKEQIIHDEVIKFKSVTQRKIIQQQLDRETFSKNNNTQKMIDYIKKPEEKLNLKYEQAAKSTIKNTKAILNSHKHSQTIFSELNLIITTLYDRITNVYKIDSKIGQFKHFFTVQSINQTISFIDNKFQGDFSKIFMEYFLDKILNNNNEIYQTNNFQAVETKAYEFKVQAKNSMRYFKSMKKLSLRLSNISLFIIKLHEKIQVLLNQIKNGMILDQEEANKLKKRITITVCPQKCPCCDRLCGHQYTHKTPHECLYGHQIRGFAGTKLKNGDASVNRCQQMTDTSKIKYNGRMMIWKQFIKEQKTKGWVYSDLVNKDKQKQENFYNVWRTVGNYFCSENNIKYVKYNNAINQDQIENTHFIIALDESQSMNRPTHWPQVLKVVEQIIPVLSSIPNSNQKIRITTLLFGSACRIHQQNVEPSNINLQIQPKWSGTQFEPVFNTAYKIMLKYHQKNNIMFILLSDGDAQFPFDQIKKIKLLQNNSNNIISYSGIEYKRNEQCYFKNMTAISNQLNGQKFEVYTKQELLKAFKTSIEVIRTR